MVKGYIQNARLLKIANDKMLTSPSFVNSMLTITYI